MSCDFGKKKKGAERADGRLCSHRPGGRSETGAGESTKVEGGADEAAGGVR